MLRRTSLLLVLLVGLLLSPHGRAGMPSPLPEDPEQVVRKVFRLEQSALARFQAISFFLLVLALAAVSVRWLWNSLQRDFPALPRLSFGKAVSGVLLWGLLFVIVLTMISGARELMTPGAWQKQGFTYKLAGAERPTTEPDAATLRRQHLERLRTALWHFAATHQGRFPARDEQSAIADELWQAPLSGGQRYLYLAGRSAGHGPALLVSEPDSDEQRFVLRVNGDIVALPTAEIQAALDKEKRP